MAGTVEKETEDSSSGLPPISMPQVQRLWSALMVAIKQDGTLWGWGSTGLSGAFEWVVQPAQIGADSDWTHVSTSHSHTLAIKSDHYRFPARV